MEKCCPGKEGHPPCRVNFSERLYEKKGDPFARALTELTRLGEPKCLNGEKLARLRVTLPSKKGDPARRVTLPAEPTFCFSCKLFAKFCKQM